LVFEDRHTKTCIHAAIRADGGKILHQMSHV
jgi:hypothetical protein